MKTLMKTWQYRDTGIKFRTYFDGKTVWYFLCDAPALLRNTHSSRSYLSILKMATSDPSIGRVDKIFTKEDLKKKSYVPYNTFLGTYSVFKRLLQYYTGSVEYFAVKHPVVLWFDEVFVPNLSLGGYVNPRTEYVPVDPKMKIEATDLVKIMEYITLLEGILDKFGVSKEDKPAYCNGLIKNVFGIDLMGKCVEPVLIQREEELKQAAFDVIKMRFSPEMPQVPVRRAIA